ncbi:DUF2058 domain-containing protein [Methylobacter sp. YRD-M1]|uniref:DUF2058 domain-containing protein n=1 Tax=Methylobacter sp. YRD-M1 TaxID=2911520 RepID=UPI00227AAE26|nr:DUF2058 domain-containing protein [Methylobacter sp. YRD-M1]WAK02080.1 DUF2058 domain-containing protein [Methylobacter sp. YRD-M1]
MSQRKLSLQEQLLKSGLTTDAKAKQIRSEKRKQQRHNNAGDEDEARRLAQKAREEQAARDRELSLLKKEQAEQKEISAQIKQLIDQNRKEQAGDDDGIAYKFSDNNKIKTVYVSEAMRDQISKGRLAIVKWELQYEIVPADAALKIKARNADCVLVMNDQAEEKIDDAYAAYQIPDDLIW